MKTRSRGRPVALLGAGLNTMTYDGDGKRRQYGDSGGVRIFLWDGENIARSRQRRIRRGEQPDLGNYWLRARVYEDGGGWEGKGVIYPRTWGPL